MRPLVNTDIKMSKQMLHALTMLEVKCKMLGIKQVSDQDVKDHLNKSGGHAMSSQFRNEFLFSDQESCE